MWGTHPSNTRHGAATNPMTRATKQTGSRDTSSGERVAGQYWPHPPAGEDSTAPMSDKPKDLLRQIRSTKEDDEDKVTLFLEDKPAAVYKCDRCERKEYRLLETNRRGTWHPAARVIQKEDLIEYLDAYDGNLLWSSEPVEAHPRIPDPEI